MKLQMKENLKVLVTQALPGEFVPVELPGAVVEHIYTGVGKANSAFRLTEAVCRIQPDLVLNVGTAGTLKGKVGDIVLCSRFVDRDLFSLGELGVEIRQDVSDRVDAFPWEWGLSIDGVCNTGDSFVTEPSELEGDVIDMEAYAQALVCKKMNIPFLAIKYVTDVIGHNSVKHWEEKLANARLDLLNFFKKVSE